MMNILLYDEDVERDQDILCDEPVLRDGPFISREPFLRREPLEQEMLFALERPPVYENPTIMQKDQQFLYMQQLIEQKRALLLQKQKHLKKAAKQNQFLEVVKSDYAKYYDYITQQKQEQIQALQLLNKYVQDLNATNEMSKYNIKDTKAEQEKIMAEIGSIKKGLDEIMSNTDKYRSL